METYTTDEEQVEKIKKWWKANGPSILAGLVIGIAGLFGWGYWNSHKLQHAGEASLNYGSLIQVLQEGNLDVAEQAQLVLQKDYSDTAYPDLGLMLIAKLQVQKGQFEEAKSSYEQLLKSQDAGIVALARIRLARTLVQLEDYDEALQLLNSQIDTVFAAVEDEIRGDAFRLKGDSKAAAEAYQRALNNPSDAVNQRLLQQKLEDVATVAG